MVPPLQKDARRDLFLRHMDRDITKITLNGKEYSARKTQPSFKRVVQATGIDVTLDFELMINIPESDPKPETLQIIKEVVSGKAYKILNVTYDFGTDCYLLQLGHKR